MSESEHLAAHHLAHLRRRYAESRQQARELKRSVREQRERSRKLVAACVGKLEEREQVVIKVREDVC